MEWCVVWQTLAVEWCGRVANDSMVNAFLEDPSQIQMMIDVRVSNTRT